MKLSRLAIASFFAIFPIAHAAVAYPLLGPEGKSVVKEIEPSQFFKPSDLSWRSPRLLSKSGDLGAVAKATLAYLETEATQDPLVVSPGLFKEMGVTLEDVKATLRFIVQVAEEDAGKPKPRLEDPDFIREHFRYWSWSSDRAAAASHQVQLPDERIRLTKYVVYQTEGRLAPEGDYTVPLYAIPEDEKNLTPAEADKARDRLLRFRFTKQQVVMGAFEKGGSAVGMAKPLVWLTRQGLEDAIMQGTIQVRLPDGSDRIYNVDRNNGIAYDRTIKIPRLQRRYWYFREVDGVKGWGHDRESKITVQPEVTVAGDIYNLGLGKVFALRSSSKQGDEIRLVILADTGGAFQPSLYQLDYLAGFFPSAKAFEIQTAHIPPRLHAGLLLLKK